MYISTDTDTKGYLLDTHTFLWSFLNTRKLSSSVKKILEDGSNTIYVSTISFWEIAIKEQLRKFSLKGLNSLLLPNIAKDYSFTILNPDAYDFVTYKELPVKKEHKDPFDRMLIHLAIRKNLAVLSHDQFFPQYEENGLQLIW